MANYKTGAQRYNDRMDRVYKKAIIAKQKYCPHSNCNDEGECNACGKNVFIGITYNPKIHKKLTCDKVISIVSRGRLWSEKVGVYWKGTDGSDILFETSPSKAQKIVEIFNGK